MLGVAIVFALIAAFVAQNWLRGQVQRRPQQVVVKQELPKTTIVVASQPLFYGAELTRQNTAEIPWLADKLPAGAFKTKDDLFKDQGSRIVLRTIETNEAILDSKVSGDKNAAMLSAIIEKSMRAITLRVNDVLGVAGFVIPGDHVDLLLTREAESGRPETTLLLQNVEVLGIDQQASEDKTKPQVVRAVTVEVTPYQAQKVALGARVGTVSLALRNRGDVAATRATQVTLADLGIGEALQPVSDAASAMRSDTAPRAPSRKASIQVTRGLKVFKYSVERERFRPEDTGPAATGGPRVLTPQPSAPEAAKPAEEAGQKPAPAGVPGASAAPQADSGRSVSPTAEAAEASRGSGGGEASGPPKSLLGSDAVKF